MPAFLNRRLALTLFAIVSLACRIPTVSKLPAEVTLRIGDEIRVSGMTLKFVDVVSDSRCPTGVVCIAVFAGDAVAAFTLSSDTDNTSFELVLNDPPRNSRTEEGLTIEFKALNPYPVAAHPTSKDDYRARLALRSE